MAILSYAEARVLLACMAQKAGSCEASLDLGASKERVELRSGEAVLPDGSVLSAEMLTSIAKEDTSCFLVEKGSVEKIERYSSETRKYYKLVPTGSAPTIEISGIRMHRMKEVNPWKDTELKLKAVEPVRGRVLDTCTGLGYTAIQAAQRATEVITVEKDENVLEIARLNPWSGELFSNIKIRRLAGDVSEKVKGFESSYFNAIIHDPPRFALAGELYSEALYRELFRILKPKGKLFHYTGSPGEKRGMDIAMGVMKRLRSAGFHRIERRKEALGVVAVK